MATRASGSPRSPVPAAAFSRPGGGRVTAAGLLEEANGLPLLLAFFKVSCPTCRLAWPYLQRLHAAYGGTAVKVVGVSQNGEDESKRFFEEYGRAAFDLVLDPEPAFAASNAFQVEAVPHLVLISHEGSFEEIFSGWSKEKMEGLGTRFAASKGLPSVPVVPPGDPVRDFQAG